MKRWDGKQPPREISRRCFLRPVKSIWLLTLLRSSQQETVAGDFPIAAIELENSREDDRVAYSLWKVLCTRAELRIVFCYRKDAAEGNTLVRHLSEQVAQAMGIQERTRIGGETMLIVGSRNESGTFPYGFFKEWQLRHEFRAIWTRLN